VAVGLMNIANTSEDVFGVTVRGVNARGISYLLARFPELRMLMSGRGADITAERLVVVVPDAIAAIIAVATGVVPKGGEGDEARQKEHEDRAAELPLGMQIAFLEPIIRLTMPQGVGPFVATLEKLEAFAAEGFGPGAGTKSSPP